MNVLLTGGAGYIGSHAALALIDNGHTVHIVDDLSRGNISLIPDKAIFTKCNIKDKATITNILKANKFDVLMHFAGFIQVEESINNPIKYFNNNTDNSITLFETCRKNGLKNIIYSSTAASYGEINKNESVSEQKILNPKNPYAESKIKTEIYLKNNSENYNFIILRYFNVAGADKDLRSGQISKKSTHLIKILSEAVLGKRMEVKIFGKDYNTLDGTAVRDFIHVSDLAEIHVEVAKNLINTSESNLFNCGYGKGYSVLEVINTVNKLYNNCVKFKFADRRKGDVGYLVSDISKITKNINWQPRNDKLEKMIVSSVNWEKKISE